MMRIAFVLCLIGWGSIPVYADDSNTIPNFHVVSPEIYRGGRPLQAGIEYLSQGLHVKTDLNLEDDQGAISAEQGFVAAEPGMTMTSIPLSGFFAPKEADVQKALAILGDTQNYPIFVHCEHGQDRTGLIVGLFRVFNQGESPADAYQEMLALGFHPILVGLDDYFRKATGYNGN